MTSTVTMHIGDVRDVMARLPDNYADLLVTSPPFLALRSYLPADHPDKHREIGSEPTPAAFLDTLYGLTADWGRLVPEWGSICVELGDTMSGSGGAGGDYNADGLREGQQKFRQMASREHRTAQTGHGTISTANDFAPMAVAMNGGPGWPLAKSMCLMPHAYTIGLAYGHNPLTGQAHDAGQWRIRNVITWARPNPPVGSLGKRNPDRRTGDYKFRPACSFITVACRGTGRYFDLDAVRTEAGRPREGTTRHKVKDGGDEQQINRGSKMGEFEMNNPAGVPPLDWHTDDLDGDWLWKFSTPHDRPPQRRRTTIRRNDPRRPLLSFITVACRGTGRYFDLDAVRVPGNAYDRAGQHRGGIKGAHPSEERGRSHILRRDGAQVTEMTSHPAGAPPLDWHTDNLDGDWLWKLATAPYPGSHYATYPLALPRRLVLAMCPTAVCSVCGWPRERVTGEATYASDDRPNACADHVIMRGGAPVAGRTIGSNMGLTRSAPTLGFTDCGHDAYRPGHVLDPFGGSGTTAVAAALEGRNATLIDLDRRNVDLVRRRLAENVRITSETHDGDTVTWTAEQVTRSELVADAGGQMDLFAS
jgi:hypothetical protein